MIDSQKQPVTNESLIGCARRWRILGIVVLLLGFVGAGVAYWEAVQSANLMDDPSMQRFNRTEHSQMGIFYGKAGYLIDDLMNALKQPGPQALVISVASLAIAAGWFFIATLPPFHRDPDFFKPSDPGQNQRP